MRRRTRPRSRSGGDGSPPGPASRIREIRPESGHGSDRRSAPGCAFSGARSVCAVRDGGARPADRRICRGCRAACRKAAARFRSAARGGRGAQPGAPAAPARAGRAVRARRRRSCGRNPRPSNAAAAPACRPGRVPRNSTASQSRSGARRKRARPGRYRSAFRGRRATADATGPGRSRCRVLDQGR